MRLAGVSVPRCRVPGGNFEQELHTVALFVDGQDFRGNTFAAIEPGTLARHAAGNLDLVEDAYARGVASLLDLLDAQTAALNAEELAANALYDYLIDLLEAKRAASGILLDERERDAFFARLDTYLAGLGLSPWPQDGE